MKPNRSVGNMAGISFVMSAWQAATDIRRSLPNVPPALSLDQMSAYARFEFPITVHIGNSNRAYADIWSKDNAGGTFIRRSLPNVPPALSLDQMSAYARFEFPM